MKRTKRVTVRRRVSALMLMLMLGVSLISYPFIAQDVTSWSQSDQLTAYTSLSDKHDYSAAVKEAKAYNQRLVGKQAAVLRSNEAEQEYMRLLSVPGTSVFARVTVPVAGIDLPVYHGTSDDVLDKGAGHLFSSSMPVGGNDTNTVITAHTGLTSAKMFDNLTRVHKGDIVKVTAAGVTLIYRVDIVKVLPPDKAVKMAVIQRGKDLVTLITCTPYTINTHRLVVQGHRVGSDVVTERESQMQGYTAVPWQAVGIIVTDIAFLTLAYVHVRRFAAQRRKRVTEC